MKLKRVLVWTVAWLMTAAAAHAQEVLKVIPEDADGFAVIAKLSGLDKKSQAITNKLSLPPMSALDLASKMLGIGKGVDVNGSAAVFLYMDESQPPAGVVALPVSDYAEVLKSLKAKEGGDGVSSFTIFGGKEAVIAKKGNFALVCAAPQQPFLTKALKGQKSILGKIQALESWLKTQDAAFVVTEKSLKLGAKTAAGKIPEELPGVPEEQAKMVKAQLDWARDFLKSAGEELTHLGVGAKIDESLNVSKTLHLGYVEKGRFSAWGKQQPKENPLVGMPMGNYLFTFAGAMSADSMKSLLNFSMEANKQMYKLSDAETKELTKATTDMMAGVQSMSFGMAVPKANEAVMSNMMGVIRLEDSAEYLKTYVTSLSKMNKILKTGSDAKAVKVAGKDGIEASMDLKTALKDNPDPNAEAMMEKLFGNGAKIQFTLVAVDSKTILFVYQPASKAKAIVDAYAAKKLLTEDPRAAQTLKNLVSNPFFVVLWSPKETAEFVDKMAKEFGQQLPIPAVGETPPIGIAGRATASSLEAQLFIPVEVIEEIGKLIQKWTTQ